MVYLKKIILFVLAFLAAFAAAELFSSYMLKYPKYGVDKKVNIFKQFGKKIKIYTPYSEYWTVEGGNNVYKRNNLGLPGIDAAINEKYGNIFVLGSSFVESLSIPPGKMATSLFQKELNNNGSDFNVLNLGSAGFNTYTDYFKSVYYEKFYYPDLVIVVFNAIYENYTLTPESFIIDSDFGSSHETFSFRISKFYLNNSSFLNLLTTLYNKPEETETINRLNREKFSEEEAEVRKKSLFNIEECLKIFYERYGNRFIAVSMLPDEDNRELSKICEKTGVNFISEDILGNSGMRIEGIGHLNENGSKKLGNLMYDAFVKFYKK